jgi:hypothetical protein
VSRPGGASTSSVAAGIRLHGALDLGFAALYAWLGFAVVPSRRPSFSLALAAVVALLALAGVALLARLRLARRLAMFAHAVLLGFCVTVLALLVASAAYLRGIYGPVGQGLAALTLVAAALVIEACGLLPIAQLRFLRRADVRRFLDGDGGRAQGG